MFKQTKMTTGLSLVAALGAYCPRVKQFDEAAMMKSMQDVKRRKRPLMGRGGYGKGILAKAAEANQQKLQAKRAKRAA